MNITIIGVGKIKEKYLKLGIDEFSKRLTKYCKLDVIELDDEKCPENLSEKDMLIVKDKEGKMVILTGGGIVAQQQVPTPDEIKSASGLVIPPPAVLAGLK